jgi:hypothetical protein
VSWLENAPGQDFASIFSLRPNLYQDFRAFQDLFAERELLPATILSSTRQRIAQLHNCSAELTRVQAPESDEPPLNCINACLEIAELFAQDPHAVPASGVAQVKAELGDAAVVALMEWLAICDGFCRFQVILEVEHDQ